MSIRTLSYRDLTQEQRRRGAQNMRTRLLGAISFPFITPAQKAEIYKKIDHIDKWEKLQLEEPKREPQHHDVSLDESVSLKENVS